MNTKNFIKIVFSAFAAAVMLFGFTTPALAHETDCPYCQLKVVQDTKEQDNEVVLRYGNKRIEYRCVMCAIAQAKSKFKNDLTILAPSNIKGKPVTITRTNGVWATKEEKAVFVFAKGSHTECQDRYRALIDPTDFDAYVANRKYTDAKKLTLKELVELSK
jgi:hypothetical protein